jgi:thiol-disulfide isomerase/thioredoxin
VVLLVAVFLAGCSASELRSSQVQGSAGADTVGVTRYASTERKSAPSLVGRTLDGKSLSLQVAGRGMVVVLNVWASWCGPCREESPMLASAARTFAPDGVLFVGIDEQDVSSKARAFEASAGASYASFVDAHGSLLSKLKMLPQMGVPSTLLLDRKGRIAARVVGPITSNQLVVAIHVLMAES